MVHDINRLTNEMNQVYHAYDRKNAELADYQRTGNKFRQYASQSIVSSTNCFQQHLISYSLAHPRPAPPAPFPSLPTSTLSTDAPTPGTIVFPHNVAHIVVCSDNIDAAFAVVHSALKTAKTPSRFVVHVFTTAVNVVSFRVMLHVFNTPEQPQRVYVHEFQEAWFPQHLQQILSKHQKFQKYKNPLNFLRFYLNEAFEALHMKSVQRIVLLDDDLLINGDLGEVYDMKLNKGHAMSAAEDCTSQKLTLYFDNKKKYLPHLNRRPWNKLCKISLGMNTIDLVEWKKQQLTKELEHWMALNAKTKIYRAGTLPPVMLVFAARQTKPYRIYTKMNLMWHHINLGWRDDYVVSNLLQYKVLHFNGVRKPWRKEIAIQKYRNLWLNYAYDTGTHEWCSMSFQKSKALIEKSPWVDAALL